MKKDFPPLKINFPPRKTANPPGNFPTLLLVSYKNPVVTFLAASKDIQHSHLIILKEAVEDYIKSNNQK